MMRRLLLVAVVAALVAAALPAAAVVDPPVLGAEVPRGVGEAVPADPIPPATERVVDGDPSDWAGEPAMFGGTAVYSAGELIYTDHLFDAHGADDGTDTERREILQPVEEAVPEAYRAEAGVKANVPGQVGAPGLGPLDTDGRYGNLPYQAHADLVELRVAVDDDWVWLLARMAQMDHDEQTALLVLAAAGGGPGVEEPFGAPISSQHADVAVLLAGDRGWVGDAELPVGSVATEASGFTNAIEARLPRALLEPPSGLLQLGAVTGTFDPDGPGITDLANVAFRLDEPVREWFDQRQALALHAGSIDVFLLDIDTAALETGFTTRWVPGPGYHERVFLSTTPGLAQESGREGVWQHYGVYLPSALLEDGEPLPLQWWLHWRGGTAHVAAMVTPGIFRHMGEDRGGIVVSPRGRGTSTWYVGRGHADFLEVWEDVFATFPADPDRVYLSGHSMGGWGSWLLSILYPDRFAAALPVAGPVTQGAWFGCEQDFCYVSANDGRPREQHTRGLLENLRNVPVGVFHGAADELVPVSGVTRQVERLVELGYRHRYYLFPGYEHYSHPVVDEWAEGVRYLDQFTREADPARVTFVRDMPFERATREVQSGGIAFDWTFDAAYWMSELTPADPEDGRAVFDGLSLARPEPPRLAVPEAGGPASLHQVGPYAMTGLAWLDDPLGAAPEAENAFEIDVAGAAQVRLDLVGMGLDVQASITGTVTTDTPLLLRLDTGSDVVEFAVEAGTTTLTL